MKFPFKIIESRYSKRDEFHTTDGFQPTHALFYLKKGSFVIEIDGIKEKVSAGDCYILFDYIHYHRKVIEPIEFIYVKFVANTACSYKMEIPFGKVNLTDKHRFISNIKRLEILLSKDDALSAGYREHLLLDILFQIHSQTHPESISKQKPIHRDILVNYAVEYIERNLNNKILIDQICRSIGTNASTLNFKFRREFNLSVGQYIVGERVKRARSLLTGTSYSITEIAARCGFQDVYYFSNVFKKLQGVSPSAYRK